MLLKNIQNIRCTLWCCRRLWLCCWYLFVQQRQQMPMCYSWSVFRKFSKILLGLFKIILNLSERTLNTACDSVECPCVGTFYSCDVDNQCKCSYSAPWVLYFNSSSTISNSFFYQSERTLDKPCNEQCPCVGDIYTCGAENKYQCAVEARFFFLN